MRVIDITHKLDENVAIYEGIRGFPWKHGAPCRITAMCSPNSGWEPTGTHMDAPCHFIEGGQDGGRAAHQNSLSGNAW